MPSRSLPISVRLHSCPPVAAVQRDRGVVGGRVNRPVDHVDAVRAPVGRVVGVPPEDLAGGEADRHHVRLKILRVDHTIHHDRAWWRTGRTAASMRHGPGHTQLRDVRAADRAGDVARVRQIAARQRPARRDRRIGRGARRGRAGRRPPDWPRRLPLPPERRPRLWRSRLVRSNCCCRCFRSHRRPAPPPPPGICRPLRAASGCRSPRLPGRVTVCRSTPMTASLVNAPPVPGPAGFPPRRRSSLH